MASTASLLRTAALALLPLASPAAAELRFDVVEGRNINSFLREGRTAAHLLLRTGSEPRILVAFPAGNSGVGLWFERAQSPVSWTLEGEVEPVTLTDAAGRPLYGIVAEAEADAPELRLGQAVLSSVRVLRDHEAGQRTPAELLTKPRIEGSRITWARDRLDGAAGYLLSIEVLDGAIRDGRLVAGRGERIRIRITAASGERPLTPLDGAALLNEEAAPDSAARDALSFLSYREKFLAGSWRFNTYFGRDTLMSVRLLMPVLQPEAVEAGLRSVLARLAPNGEVAHEEDIGEFAVLRHLRESGKPSAAPIYDYAMVDDDFMLASVAAAWLLDDPRGSARAPAFLAGGNGATLVRNLRWVVDRAAAFAAEPVAANLVGLKPGRAAGQWRDSQEGLGRGRYAYDVNAVFVPAALDAAARLLASGLLDPHLDAEARASLGRAEAMAHVWRTKAPPLFDVTIPADEAQSEIRAYAAGMGIPAATAGPSPLRFPALALDDQGRPIPILHSDVGFALLFGSPAPAALDSMVSVAMRPFPAGLLTPVGLLVANPAFATSDVEARFGPNAYHGAVVWSWQQAVLAAGLGRQLGRDDLPPPVRARLEAARKQLWQAIEAADEVRTSELWSWRYADGRYQVAPFGADAADEDESNAAQLWSTVFLALQPRR